VGDEPEGVREVDRPGAVLGDEVGADALDGGHVGVRDLDGLVAVHERAAEPQSTHREHPPCYGALDILGVKHSVAARLAAVVIPQDLDDLERHSETLRGFREAADLGRCDVREQARNTQAGCPGTPARRAG
jgi:hypothetical protein